MWAVLKVTYDHELILIEESFTEDEIGNQIPDKIKRPVLCQVKSIGSNEFYNAATSGLKPVIEFIIHGYEYDGESKVEFEGTLYSIIRTYKRSYEEIELTCQKVIGND
jgi:SPP1 family predicted phage head-tail adaptor